MTQENARRSAALLLHPSSLYSPYGIGDLGPEAHGLISFLQKAKFSYWQILPLTPTSQGLGNSPYSAYSAFAGNPLLISLEFLARDGWLEQHELTQGEIAPASNVDFAEVEHKKNGLLQLAFERAMGRYGSRLEGHYDFQIFCGQNDFWLFDFAKFMAAKAHFGGGSWLNWPEALRRRDEGAWREYEIRLSELIWLEKFKQYLFFHQLGELKGALKNARIGLIGDMPIYVNGDSAEVWSQPHLFHLDDQGNPTAVAGVPPDYFSQEGQRWGNPLFNWENHRQSGFAWWRNRLRLLWQSCDLVRLDHFRAFAAYWEVPADAPNAIVGRWQPGPGEDFFAALGDEPLKLIAEDLGIITPDVTALRQKFHLPGMRVLQFAFGSELATSPHTPYNIQADNLAYSATHDNNTTCGWFRQEATDLVRKQLSDLAGYEVTGTNAGSALVRLAWLSPAQMAVAPLQDLLNLDETARLNTPGTTVGNWGWRLDRPGVYTDRLAEQMAELGSLAGRA